MGTNPKVYFLGGMGGRSLVLFQGRNVGFFNFPRNYFFGNGKVSTQKFSRKNKQYFLNN
jgi:hypothetical protein